MPQMFIGHQRHAVFNGVVATDVEDVAGHQLADGCGFGGAAQQDDFAGIISFGKNSDNSVVYSDHHGSDIGLRHQFQCRIGTRLRGNRPDLVTFGLQQITHRVHSSPR